MNINTNMNNNTKEDNNMNIYFNTNTTKEGKAEYRITMKYRITAVNGERLDTWHYASKAVAPDAEYEAVLEEMRKSDYEELAGSDLPF